MFECLAPTLNREATQQSSITRQISYAAQKVIGPKVLKDFSKELISRQDLLKDPQETEK